MTGLDKILKTIEEEAAQKAEIIIKQAENEVAFIIEKAGRKGTQEALAIVEKAEKNAKEIMNIEKSSAEITKRKLILAEKASLINSTINDALNYLYNLTLDEYFDLLLKMIGKFALPLKGNIVFSQKDFDNIPRGFKTAVSKIAKEKGGDLKVSPEIRNIDGGFVLVYGEIEQNCSFKALIEDYRDEIFDKLAGLLF